MTNEQQYLVWMCLPKEARDEIKERYKTLSTSFLTERYMELNNIFGHCNLISNIEPAEMLIVSRKKVQEMYDYNNNILLTDPINKGAKLLAAKLKELFGDKCLHDKA